MECVVADAVVVEPVSKGRFPANREKNRDLSAKCQSSPPPAATISSIFGGLRGNSLRDGTGKFPVDNRQWKLPIRDRTGRFSTYALDQPPAWPAPITSSARPNSGSAGLQCSSDRLVSGQLACASPPISESGYPLDSGAQPGLGHKRQWRVLTRISPLPRTADVYRRDF